MINSWPLKRYLYDAMRGKQRDYTMRVHQLRFSPLALNTDYTAESMVEPAEPFLWTAVAGYAFDTATGLQVTPDATISIRLGGAGGRRFSRDAVHWMNFSGEQTMPHNLPAAILVPGATSFHGTLTLLSGVLTLNLALLFLGARVRRWSFA